MQYLPNGMQMKEADTYTIEQEHIPSSELMERAANACVSCMIDSGYDLGNILIVCGKGSDGGDLQKERVSCHRVSNSSVCR